MTHLNKFSCRWYKQPAHQRCLWNFLAENCLDWNTTCCNAVWINMLSFSHFITTLKMSKLSKIFDKRKKCIEYTNSYLIYRKMVNHKIFEYSYLKLKWNIVVTQESDKSGLCTVNVDAIGPLFLEGDQPGIMFEREYIFSLTLSSLGNCPAEVILHWQKGVTELVLK